MLGLRGSLSKAEQEKIVGVLEEVLPIPQYLEAGGPSHAMYWARALLAAAAGTELEALALRWSDLDKGTAHIARTLWWESGGKAHFGSPKGGKGRNVHLTARAVEALRRHRIRQKEQRLAAPVWVEHGLVVTNPIGEPLRHDHVDRRHFQPLLRKAGLPRYTLHVLRHTAATLLLRQGTHPSLVQALLGHASVSMTLDKYSHYLPSMGDQTARAMDAAFGL